MKAKIHPQYHHNTKVICACGNSFETGSTLPEIKVDICSACHPFFTGEMKFVDTQGRVEKFQAKMAQAGKYQSKNTKKATKNIQEDQTPLTLREMIQAQRKQKSESTQPIKNDKSKETSKKPSK